MKNILLIFILGALVDLLAPSAMALAEEVAYDDVDYAALRLAGQSEQPQASDQVLLIYRQVLTFDENTYRSSYDQDMLVASVSAGAVVLSTDKGSSDLGFRFWADTASMFSTEDLGYTDGQAKHVLLTSTYPRLGGAQSKALRCVKSAVVGVLACVAGRSLSARAAKSLASISLLGRIGGASGRFVGTFGLRVISVLLPRTFWYILVLCILFWSIYGLACYFFT